VSTDATPRTEAAEAPEAPRAETADASPGMSAAALAATPALRAGIVLGPGLRSGGTVVHHVKDPETGWFYRVGPREHFIMVRFDGRHTLGEIAGEYLATFGRRLAQEHWNQIFTMLGTRQLLAGAADPAALSRLADAHAERRRADRSPMRQRRALFHPDAWCAAMARRLRWAYTAWFVVPALLAVLALEVFVATHLTRLADDAHAGAGLWLSIPAGLAGLWLITALHEAAHGVTCKHFGGAVPEIGVMWRFPMFAPYCKTDDVVLFQRRHARVATAFAGVFVSLLALLPVLAWWALSAGHPVSRGLAAGLLMFGSVTAWLNLVPLFQLDGYHMLAHALRVAELRTETVRYAGLVLRRDPRRLAYGRSDRWIYTVYGSVSAVVIVVGYAALCFVWFHTLDRWTGPAVAAAVPVLVTLLILAFLAYARRRMAR
jgi:putative peptide zinc metalloprotease protein